MTDNSFPVTYSYDRANTTTERHDFGVVDSKGRAIGAFVTLAPFTVTRNLNPGQWWTPGEEADLGDWYEVRPQATRDGQKFGAIAVAARFQVRTLAEAAPRIEKYLAAARKRAAKLAAPRVDHLDLGPCD